MCACVGVCNYIFRFLYLPKFCFTVSTSLCFQANVVNLISFCFSHAVVTLLVNLGVSDTINIMSLIYTGLSKKMDGI